MRVHSYDERSEVGDFHPAEGNLTVYKRSVVPNRSAPVRGHYAILNRTLAIFYRDGKTLKFFLEGVGSIELNAGVNASWKLVTKNKAQLSFDTEPPVEITYRSDYNRVISHLAGAPNTTREDLDFGLYVSNALKDEARRELLYRDETS